uniref:Uncharacterized protein n=1 Tax=Anopheles culicifacies TaxID=139723 RepID=A0A182MH36_9DIPT
MPHPVSSSLLHHHRPERHGSSSYSCSCGKTANRSDKSKHASHTHSHHHQHNHQPHSTISSSIRKELASYENPYQAQAAGGGGGGVRKKPTKRNASTESLDLFDKCPPDECSCGLYSPSSINGGKSCRKCSACDTGGPKSGTQQKKHNSSKFKDASTSPKSCSPMKTIAQECRSPKMEASTDTKFDFNLSPKTESHYRRLSSLSINSSGKHPVTASPMKQSVTSTTASPKASPQKLTPMRTLEKSNSLGESKPPRLLRNTRSLSPRPPVRHQHSIMVSDENDIISVKLSPNEEYDDETGKRGSSVRLDMETGNDAPTMKSTASANGGGGGGTERAKKLSDCLKSANSNRSTSCLVYVPSDPWTRMSASNSPLPSSKQQQKSKTLDNSSKSYGKPCLDYMKNSDPWVWRSNVNLPERLAGKGGKKRTAALPHQTKSLTSTISRDDSDVSKHQPKLCQQQSLGRFEKTLTIPGVDGSFDARKKITRPKLQRSKSPSFYEDFFQQPPSGGGGGGSLNLLNPNMLQPRHSFSTPSQKDDELQLNIRRLSEQMNKYSHSSAFPSPPAFLNDTILQQQVGAASKKVGGSGSSLTVGPSAAGSIGGLNEASQRKTASHSKINEPILETRC